MTGIFNNNNFKPGKPPKDTRTGKVYESRNQVYLALATSERLPIDKTLGWYDLCRRYPLRFEDVTTGKLIDQNGRLVDRNADS